jgi:hypothetical protein
MAPYPALNGTLWETAGSGSRDRFTAQTPIALKASVASEFAPDLMAVAIAGHRLRIDRVRLIPAALSRLHPRSSAEIQHTTRQARPGASQRVGEKVLSPFG